MDAGSKSTETARIGQEFRSVPVMPNGEASRRKELNVSKMRARESVMRRTGLGPVTTIDANCLKTQWRTKLIGK